MTLSGILPETHALGYGSNTPQTSNNGLFPVRATD
ncbi:hypothetical protein JOD27_004381 [Lentzea nigeriaca]|nr:hypothetical protein [Lentzea nigeriaca]